MQSLINVYVKPHPGGIHYDPEPEVKRILASIQPSIDFCESLLGLNNYLTIALPKLSQFA